jgi:hypothetical protein
MNSAGVQLAPRQRSLHTNIFFTSVWHFAYTARLFTSNISFCKELDFFNNVAKIQTFFTFAL